MRTLDAPPQWAKNKQPTNWFKRCYRTKSMALHAFVSHNQNRIDRAGGLHKQAKDGSFDAVNERYGLRKQRKARSIAEALWVTMPQGKPWCLDRLDLETLNATAPAKEAGGFLLPDHVENARLMSKERRFYANRTGSRQQTSMRYSIDPDVNHSQMFGALGGDSVTGIIVGSVAAVLIVAGGFAIARRT